MKIREVNINDIPTISKLHKVSWQEAYKNLISEKYLNNISDNHWVAMLENGIKNNSMEGFVVLDNDIIVACAFVGKSRYIGYENDLELISIYALPDYFGKGCGHLLIKEIKKLSKENKYKKICLWVLEGNDRAIKFYEREGFLNNGETTSFEIMNKKLVELRYIFEF